MASPRLCKKILLHQRVRIAATKAATQARHSAVAQVHWSARLNPAPTRNPRIDPRIMCDFIESFTSAKQNLCHRPLLHALQRKIQCLPSIFLWKEQGGLCAKKFTGNFLPGAQKTDWTICAQDKIP